MDYQNQSNLCQNCGMSYVGQRCPNCGVPAGHVYVPPPTSNPKKGLGAGGIIAIIFGSVILVVALFFIGCTACFSSNNSASSYQQEQPAPVTPQPEPEPEEIKHSIGDTVVFDDWEITVTSYEFVNRLNHDNYWYSDADDGNKLLVVHVTVKNIYTEPQTFLPTFSGVSTELVYQDEYRFGSLDFLGMSDDDLHGSTLNPLSEKNGIIVFQVAEEVAADPESIDIKFKTLLDSAIISLS